MKTFQKLSEADSGIARLAEKPETRELIDQVFRKVGWPDFRHPYDPSVDPHVRQTFMDTLPPGLDRRFSSGLIPIMEHGLRIEQGRLGDTKAKLQLLKKVQGTDPVTLLTGRDFRGLPRNLRGNLDTAFKTLWNYLATFLVRYIQGEGSMALEKDELYTPAHLWARDHGHTFFMGDQLLESLEDTDIHGDFSLLETKWPMESFMVVLPRPIAVNLISDSSGQETSSEVVAFIMACPECEECESIESTTARRLEIPTIMPLSYDCEKGVPSVTLICKDDVGVISRADTLEGPLKSFLFTLLHVWVEKPELIERGHRLGHKVARTPGAKPAWSPNYIGRTYRIPERHEGPGEGDGRRVRRKVRGHFKWQPHGQGRKLRKRIFIEPYWAGSIEL